MVLITPDCVILALKVTLSIIKATPLVTPSMLKVSGLLGLVSGLELNLGLWIWIRKGKDTVTVLSLTLVQHRCGRHSQWVHSRCFPHITCTATIAVQEVFAWGLDTRSSHPMYWLLD